MSEKNPKNWKKFKEEADIQSDTEFDNADDYQTQVETPLDLDNPEDSDLREQLLLAEQKSQENLEKAMRALAELDNVRRRADREVTNAHRFGQEKLIVSLLPVLDSLEQALQLASQHGDEGMHEGLELTMKLFLDALSKHNVHPLDPKGAVFDPQQHEAMSMQKTTEAEHNTVLSVFQKGYLLNDRVIRPARVIVANRVD